MINVVGAGIAGSLVAHLLRKRGVPVRVIDDNDVNSASRASSNLYVASWLKKFSSAEAALGVHVVEDLFGDKIDQPFSSGIAEAAKVRHIAQRHLLVTPDVVGVVTGVMSGANRPGVLLGDGKYDGPVILCTGYRGPELARGVQVTVKVGHCIHFRGRLPKGKSSLTLVSPYTHAKLYQLDEDTIYFADSVAVKPETYAKRSKELQERTLRRAVALLGYEPEVKSILVGHRPFVPGHDFARCELVAQGVWSLNGGGKNGIVAYAAAAHRLVSEITA